jgi:ribokinase
MNQRVTIVGSLNMDLTIRSPRIPRPGETILGSGFHTAPGGKGANQAVAAARLGSQVAMVGRLGADSFGSKLRQELSSAGVDHKFIIRDEKVATGVAFIVVDDGGENSIVVAPGANMRLTPADVKAAENVISASSVLLLQLEVPIDTVIRATQIAQAHNVPVILNPAPAQKLPSQLLNLVNILIPNETETRQLTGLPVSTIDEIQAASVVLREKGPEHVIITLGSRGALLSTDDTIEFIPTFKISPVDTTAAGDAFVSAFAVALAEGKALAEAVRYGNAAGSLATTKLGAQPSLPTRDEVETLLANKEEMSHPKFNISE